MRAADCKPYRPFYELLTGKELPWPKAASVVGLFHIRMSPIGTERTSRPGLMRSVHRRRPEVTGSQPR
jgi:hypothetical protein